MEIAGYLTGVLAALAFLGKWFLSEFKKEKNENKNLNKDYLNYVKSEMVSMKAELTTELRLVRNELVTLEKTVITSGVKVEAKVEALESQIHRLDTLIEKITRISVNPDASSITEKPVAPGYTKLQTKKKT